MVKKKEMCGLGFPAESQSWSIAVASVRNLEVILPQSHPQ
jgi:hypothetical protein